MLGVHSRMRPVRVRPRVASAAAVLALLAGSLVVSVQPVNAAAQAAPVPTTAPDAKSAAALAMSSGTRVEVMSERTEFTQTFAEPSGTFTNESAVVPQRVHRADGSWADVDLSVVAGADGLIRPRASVADVRFSAGGTGAMVTVVKGGKKFTVSWPLGSLPKPTLSGDSATYAGVLPDVDLVVRATAGGFAHVLVLKTAAAAANPRLQAITFDLGGDARVSRLHDGSLTAVAGNTTIATASPAAMWDSRMTTAVAAKTAQAQSAPTLSGAMVDPFTPETGADKARTGDVATAANAAGDLVLRPDAALLSAATFPLFIDPAWSTAKTRWAYSTNNNTNNTDVSRARVGKDPDGRVYRSYFEFPTSAIKNKYVYRAYMQITLDHSWSCTSTPNTMFSTNPITGTPRTAWKATGWYIRMLAQVSSHANEGAGCSDSPQPDVSLNFFNEATNAAVQAVAKAGGSSATMVLSANDSTVASESTTDRWQKY